MASALGTALWERHGLIEETPEKSNTNYQWPKKKEENTEVLGLCSSKKVSEGERKVEIHKC